MSNAHDVAHAPKHPYHLVDPSPWPIIGAVFTFALAAGAIWWMHNGPLWLMLIGGGEREMFAQDSLHENFIGCGV